MSFDLTGARWLRRVVKNPFFPAVLQWLTLGCFVYLILVGWNYHGIRGIELEDPLVYTNLNTLFFWTIWLMGLILLIPLIGRLWCTVCPLGYLNDLLARWGLRLRYPRRLKNLYLAAVLLVFYNGLVAFFSINHYPDYSSRLLLAVVGVLVVAGLLFRGRIFCGYLCPVGAMVGVYSRVSPWRLEARDREVCKSCPSKACYLGEEKWYRLATPLAVLSFPFRRPGCQVDLFPPELSEDPRCVMCTQCIKNCPYDNVVWGTRPFLRGVASPGIPGPSEAVFITFLIGATSSIFLRVWPGLNSLAAAPAESLAAALGAWGAWGEVIRLAWGYMALPAALTVGLAALAVFLARTTLAPVAPPAAGGPGISFGLPERDAQVRAEREGWESRRRTVRGVFSVFTLAFIPVVLASHAAFALVKVNEKLAYLQGALRDPTGVKFYLAIHRLGMMAAPGEIVPLAALRWVSLLLVAAGTAGSVAAALKLAGRFYPDLASYRRWGGGVFAAAGAGLGLVMSILVVKWLF